MRRLLPRLEQSLRRVAPALYERLRSGATPEARDAAEAALGRALPDPLRRLYGWRDGQTGKGTFPARGRTVARGAFLSLGQATAFRRDRRPADWEESWWPLIDGGDGDLLAVDLERGTVIEFRHETRERPMVFPSLEAWLEAVVSGLETTERPAVNGRTQTGASCVKAYLGKHGDAARSWPDLRRWIRGLKACGATSVFARIALAPALDERPRDQQHPAVGALIDSVEGWLREPTAVARRRVQDAVAARNRTFVPAAQVSFAAQHAAHAATAESLDRACDEALHALAKSSPGLVDGRATDEEANCLELQRSIRSLLGDGW